MRLLFTAVLFCFTSFYFLHAQSGKLKGTVSSKSGELLGFVYVIPTPGEPANVVLTDFDGRFFLKVNPGKYRLSFRLAGFRTKEVDDVSVTGEDTTVINVVLEEDAKLDTVQVVAKAVRGSFVENTEKQKNNISSSEVVGKQLIESRPVSNSGDVIKMAAGASIQDNRFAVIRGLNDRYNGAYLNGSALPSTESDRKAFSFDIFPSNMLEYLMINKTATADMPAEFGGGLILINTKSIPEKNFISFGVTEGYNTVATGKQSVYYIGGKTDWLGLDDGSRALPSGIPSRENFPVKINEQAEIAKNLRNDWALYNGKFDPNTSMQFSLGRNFKRKIITDGMETKRNVFGLLLSLTYSRSYNLLETTRRSYTNNTDNEVDSQLDNEYSDKACISQTLAGGMANFSWNITEKNSISFRNIFSINTDNRVISRSGTTNPLDVNPTLVRANARWFTSNRIYSGQVNGEHLLDKIGMKINWLGGYSNVKRSVPNLRRSVYTRFKTFNDPSDPYPNDTMYMANISVSTVSPDNGGGIFNSNNSEDMMNGRADVSKSFSWGEVKNDSVIEARKQYRHFIDLKTGMYYQRRQRQFEARQLGLTRYHIFGGNVQFDESLVYLPEEEIFSNEHMGLMANGKGGFKLVDATKPTDTYDASSFLTAGYFMIDYRFKSFARIVGGIRYEHFNQLLNSKYDNGKPVNLNVTKADILPSLNTIFHLTEKQNVRMSYAQTVNRPEFRELAPFAFYDFNTQFLYSGNENLKRALIHNIDVRYELFPGRGQILTATFFYKNFIDPIEQVSRADVSGEVYYANVPKAQSKGAEAEFRFLVSELIKPFVASTKRSKVDSMRFLSKLTVYANAAIISSKVVLTNNAQAQLKERQLQGQSPYIFNAGLIFSDRSSGWSVSLAANRIGQRIYIVGNVNEPHIWENGRTVADVQIAKKFVFGKNSTRSINKSVLEIKFNLRDGLAQDQYFFQDKNGNRKLDKEKDDVVWQTRYGRIFSLGASLTF